MNSVASSASPGGLSERQLRALERLGDCLLPGGGALPPFSEIAWRPNLSRVLDHMPARDRRDLAMLLTVLGWWPRIAPRLVLVLLDGFVLLPRTLGQAPRLARLAIRGLVMSLYYSDSSVLASIGYDPKVGRR